MALYDSALECFACGKSFVHAATLREHEDYSCQEHVLCVCIPCGLTFDSNLFLDQHLIRHNRRAGVLCAGKKDLMYSSLYKCNVCKTAFMSPFTLATHQLYSCPITSAFTLQDSPEATTTCSEAEPESSDDEGKLKIVERTLKCRKIRGLNKKDSKITKVSGNRVSIRKPPKTFAKETKLSCIKGTEKNALTTSSSLNKKESPNLNTTKRSDDLGFTSSKNIQVVGEMKQSEQDIKKPLKVLLKLKDAVNRKPFNAETFANVFPTNPGNSKDSQTVAPGEDPVAQVASADIVIKENEREICDFRANNDVVGNKKEFDVGGEKKNMVKLKERSFKPKTYPCRLCGRCFTYSETRGCHENVVCRRRTISSKEEDEPYKCTKCDFVLMNSNDFDLHTVMKCSHKLQSSSTHVSNKISCQYCPRQFVERTTMKTHMEYCCTARPNGHNLKLQIVTSLCEKKTLLSSCN